MSKKNGNIVIIGFMGVGKGTIARAYNKKYKTFIIDTDDLIESKANMTIKKIFKKYGEDRFRAMEQEVADWIEKSLMNTMVSCGGGFYKVKNIDKLGTVVLLDASFEWIYDRLKNAKNSKAKFAKRPLFRDIDKAKELYDQRIKEYRKVADIIINVEGKSKQDICNEIYKIKN